MRAIFFDRDGVLNVERGTYTFNLNDFAIVPGALHLLKELKSRQFRLIVVTNQAGISLGLYTREQMNECHKFLQEKSGNIIDAFYYAPAHPTISNSLSRKPGSLMFERAISRYHLDPEKCWMVGDREKDLIPARKLGIKTIFFSKNQSDFADFSIDKLSEIQDIILH